MRIKVCARNVIAAMLAVMLCFFGYAPAAFAADQTLQAAAVEGLTSTTASEGNPLAPVQLDANGAYVVPLQTGFSGSMKYLQLTGGIANVQDPIIADSSVVEYKGRDRILGMFKIMPKKVGVSNVTLSNGTDSFTFPLVVYPVGGMDILDVRKASYNTIRISWESVPGVSGYRIFCAPTTFSNPSADSFVKLGEVNGASTTTAILPTRYYGSYYYAVQPVIVYNGTAYCASVASSVGNSPWTIEAPRTSISMIKQKSGRYLQIGWTADAGAASFTVYRSTKANAGFKKIATTRTKSYIDRKVVKGKTYYYKVAANFPGYGQVTSRAFKRFVPGSLKVLRKKADFKYYMPETLGYLGYGNNVWASPDPIIYYSRGSKTYAVVYFEGKLKIHVYDKNMKRTSVKNIKLPKHDVWGGFYHGKDGNNYIALGWNNHKESKKKTVIQVIKYSAGWKKGKVAKIRGSASNVFPGVYEPFYAGGSAFEMRGSTLYLHTSRKMFKGSDGSFHQSNITFKINTKTMKASVMNAPYVSHSFNQKVRIADDVLYFLDQCDAYPARGLVMSMLNVNKPDAKVFSWSTFDFMGAFGENSTENSTGCTVGDMEIGSNNVLVCGTALPHGYTIKGVTGFRPFLVWKKNAFVMIVNPKTKESKVVWLTSISPKSKTQTVGEARMVKLADDRFAVMFSIRSEKTGASNLKYIVVDDNGKKVLAKTYKNIWLTGQSQPILKDGCISWLGKPPSKKSKDPYYSPYLDSTLTMYRIPALY